MARIRTIKPEFPQSESMGRVSRDSRLLFVELWTLCDDSGRTRGNSRMLASLLFPYDDDAPEQIDGWIDELEKEGCIVRYIAEGSTYIQVLNWLNHQKIDKPSPSKIPEFVESSRIISNPRESSSVYQGVDQGKDQGKEGNITGGSPPVEKETLLQDGCKKTWVSYASAYKQRYSVDPVRNAKVSSQIKQFVKRIGIEEAPDVAAFFLKHEAVKYIQNAHGVGYLLNDCEKLRTEWATGRVVVVSSGKPVATDKPWFLTSTGIVSKAESLGLPMQDGEAFPYFKQRVYQAAGVTADMLRAAQSDFGARV